MAKNPAPFGKGTDYMEIQHTQHDKAEAPVPMERGNNAGPLADGMTDVGKADLANDGSYAAGLAEAKNHNS